MAAKPLKNLRYIQMGPIPAFVGICTCEKAFKKELTRLGIKEEVKWLDEDASACVHEFYNTKKGLVCLMTIDPDGLRGHTKASIAGLMAHEATHVWQNCKTQMKEYKPGEETEAYTVGYLTQSFIEIYEEFTKRA